MTARYTGDPPTKEKGQTAVRPAALGSNEQANSSAQPPAQQPAEGAFTSRRRFLIWACMAGFVGPERVTERILADLDNEVGS